MTFPRVTCWLGLGTVGGELIHVSRRSKGGSDDDRKSCDGELSKLLSCVGDDIEEDGEEGRIGSTESTEGVRKLFGDVERLRSRQTFLVSLGRAPQLDEAGGLAAKVVESVEALLESICVRSFISFFLLQSLTGGMFVLLRITRKVLFLTGNSNCVRTGFGLYTRLLKRLSLF